MIKTVNKILCVVLINGLVACGSSEQSIIDYMQQGRELFQQDRLEKAVLAYKNVLQIDPKHVEAHFLLAETLSKVGKIKKAYAHYIKVINLDEQHYMSRVRVGQLMLLTKQQQKAEEYLQEALKLAPDNVEVLLFQSAIDLAKKNSVMALEHLEKALSINPESTTAIAMKASIYAKRGEAKEAIKLLEMATAGSSGNETLHLMLANLYMQSNLQQNAEEELRLLIKLKPDAIRYYKGLALFYVKQDKLAEAEQVLKSAVDKVSDNEVAQLYLLDFLATKRSLEVAIDQANALVAEFPDVFQYQFRLFSLLLKTGDVDTAELTVKKIISAEKFGANKIKANNALSRLYAATNRPTESRQLIAEILSENPKDAEALLLRAQFSLADKKYSDAIIDLRSVLLVMPKNIKALKMLSGAQIANNDLDLAKENLEKLLAIKPEDIESRQKLVDLQLHSGHKTLAQSQIDTILKLDPDNNKALASLFKLKIIQQDWNQAQSISKRLEDKAMGFYLSGLAYQAEKKPAKSNAAFKRSLLINPDAVQPLLFLVKNFSESNHIAEGIEFLNTLTQKFPQNVVVLDQLGQFYAKNNDMVKAEKIFNQVIKMKPDWFQGYKNLAKLSKIKRDLSTAKEILKTGLENTKGSFDLLNDIVVIYHHEKEFDKIINLYQQAYKDSPDSLIIINNLAGYLSDYGIQSEETLANAEKIAQPLAKSENPNYLDTVAWIAYKQKNYDKAQKLLEHALEMGGKHIILSYHLGMVYYHQGTLQLAKRYLQKAVAAKSEFHGLSEAKRILEQINDTTGDVSG